MAEVALFESNLLSPEVQSLLPPGYTLRALRSNDYERGFLDVLTVLTEVGGHTKKEFTGEKKKRMVLSDHVIKTGL
jgi:glucosamine-phosphate N-acetyltransferase